jgi:hypothetical protein
VISIGAPTWLIQLCSNNPVDPEPHVTDDSHRGSKMRFSTNYPKNDRLIEILSNAPGEKCQMVNCPDKYTCISSSVDSQVNYHVPFFNLTAPSTSAQDCSSYLLPNRQCSNPVLCIQRSKHALFWVTFDSASPFSTNLWKLTMIVKHSATVRGWDIDQQS